MQLPQLVTWFLYMVDYVVVRLEICIFLVLLYYTIGGLQSDWYTFPIICFLPCFVWLNNCWKMIAIFMFKKMRLNLFLLLRCMRMFDCLPFLRFFKTYYYPHPSQIFWWFLFYYVIIWNCTFSFSEKQIPTPHWF